MAQLRSVAAVVGMLSLSAALVAEQGKLVLHVADTEGRPVANLALSTLGMGGGEQRTDGTGRAILVLAPGTRENSHVQLQIVRSPKGHDFVLFDPWNGRAVQVPSFENDAMNFVAVTVAERGSLSILRNPKALAAQINEARAPKLAGKQAAEVSPKESLEAVSKQYGLAPEEVDKAIRAWGEKATDPYDVGLAALYARNYPEATKQLTASLAAREKGLKRAQDGVVVAAEFLGQSLHAQGHYREAVEAQDRALQVRPDDPGLMNAKALSLFGLGDYSIAEKLYRHALELREKTLALDQPDLAVSLNNLAAVLYAEGNYTEAEPLYRRALKIDEKVLGVDHPDTATILCDLAALLYAKEDYTESEKLYRRSLAIDEKTSGDDHPNTAVSLANLAELLRAKGELAEAERLSRRALAIDEKLLGDDHPDTATSVSFLAEVLRAKGDLAEAEALCRRALAIYEKTLGSEDSSTATSLNNLARVLEAKQDYVNAEPLYKRALDVDEKALGMDHPSTKIIRNNLARVEAKLK